MKVNIFQMVFAVALVLLACCPRSSAFEKQTDGVLFKITKQQKTDAQWLKIQVCSESIIRVVASPVASFSNRPSLMVAKAQWPLVPWSLKEQDNWVEIATAKVTVRVQPQNGTIAFFDAKGNLLLQEKEGGGKIGCGLGIRKNQGCLSRRHLIR